MVGGRPIEGLIQGVGGVKGATALTFDDIYAFTAHFQSAASTDAQKAALSRYSDLPMKRSIYAGVNAKDLILRSHLNDGLPAQFVVEKADCRLYHTQAMVADITAMWKATADAGFRGAKCAAGAISPGRGRKPRAAKRTDAVVHRAVVGNGQPGKLVELPQFQASHHVAIGI